jgi:hypothetical protein
LQVAGTEYDQVFLIHNVGSLGDLSKKAHEYENIEQLNRFMTLNFTGMVALTTRAMREFARSTKKVRKPAASANDHHTMRLVMSPYF